MLHQRSSKWKTWLSFLGWRTGARMPRAQEKLPCDESLLMHCQKNAKIENINNDYKKYSLILAFLAEELDNKFSITHFHCLKYSLRHLRVAVIIRLHEVFHHPNSIGY